MATYISLIHWTDQGMSAVKDTLSRARAAAQSAEKMGGKLTQIYWTVGKYDLVTVTDFPDDETATAFLLALGMQGSVRTTTMRAYDADTMAGIVGKLG